MVHEIESPMDVVENATMVLCRISSICSLMMNINDHDFAVQAEDVAQVMAHFRLCLDAQIKALSGIQWAKSCGKQNFPHSS